MYIGNGLTSKAVIPVPVPQNVVMWRSFHLIDDTVVLTKRRNFYCIASQTVASSVLLKNLPLGIVYMQRIKF